MGLTMTERKAVVRQMAARYRQARKKDKGRLLDELVELTGYSRWYAVGLLGDPVTKRAVAPKRRVLRVAERRYDAPVLEALRRIWAIMDCIFGKRLAAVLPQTIVALERASILHRHLGALWRSGLEDLEAVYLRARLSLSAALVRRRVR